jgi:hypothetical protein
MALWPPVEAGLSPDALPILVEGDALRSHYGVEIGEGVEVPVGDRLVDMDPEGFRRLQLRRVGRQVDEADAIGNGKARLGMPAGVVEDEEDDALGSRAGLAGEEGERVLEQCLGDAVREVPEAFAGGRRDEGGDVEPLEAVVAGRDGPLAPGRPDPA